MEYKCPSCKNIIIVKKERLVNCHKCKSKLLLVSIGNKKQLIDVTPKEG